MTCKGGRQRRQRFELQNIDFGGITMDFGVIVAISCFSLSALLVVLVGIVAAVSAVTGFKSNNDED